MTEEQPKASLQPSSGNSNATISPSPAKNNNPYAKMSGAVSPSAAKNPYLKMSPTSPTATNVLASPSPPCASKSSSTLTDEQRTKIEENRKRALERRVASLVEQEPNKKARLDAPKCLRCGSYDKNTLCIKWDHDGDIERERAFGSGPYGWDAFRYDCCGRLAPNPCFVGQHNFGTTSSNRHLMGMRNMVLQCDCHNGPARLVETKKEGPNCGRYFFRCSSDRRADCKFFMWADVAFNLPPQRRQPSRDGIKEWINIYANPFDQQLHWLENTASLMPTSCTLLRERLIAAMLMHECCSSVTGGMVCSMPHLNDMVEKVRKCFEMDPNERNEKLEKDFLYPLTQSQIARRFGVSFDSADNDPLFSKSPTFDECRDALAKAVRENSVLRTTGVKLETLSRPDISVTFVKLEGLENYFAI